MRAERPNFEGEELMASSRAIVIGGSMAGLCAARVLSDFFERVTVVDRDSYPDGALERAGVPQSRHVHALLAGGRHELNALFPDFDRLMIERGAHELDFGMDFATLRGFGWAQRTPGSIPVLFASRLLIESIVRELLRRIPNVELIERTEAAGLIAQGGATLRATALKLRSRDGAGSSELAADLIVDASGRTSKAPLWFKELGLSAPEETVVDSFSAYGSRWYNAPPPERRPRDWWWKGLWLEPKPPENFTAGVLFPIENGRWLVTIAGIEKHYPPTDEEGFTATLQTLRSPILAEAVRLAEPISPVYSNRAMANRWRRYEKWNERLDGFVALGDSVCAFNPVYGQGMTTGAMSALILRDSLKTLSHSDPNFARKFLAAQARFQSGPWGMATGADFRFEGTVGQRPRFGWLFAPYMAALFEGSLDDKIIQRRLDEVINMLRPPSALFGPSIAARTVLGAMSRMFRAKAEAQPIPAMPPVAAPAR
jgi:2-polyprenyl-6-methoxyphenol hydroxylase-like FAD-dependent oxidoreductase